MHWAQLTKMFCPQCLSEAAHISLWKLTPVVLHGVVWLIASQSNFRVASSCHGAIVNVCGSNNDILIVHDHHLGVNVNHHSARFGENVCITSMFWWFISQRKSTIGNFTISKEEEVEIVRGFGVTSNFFQCIMNHAVHGINSSELPIKNFLNCSACRKSLRMKRNCNVSSKALVCLDFVDDLASDFKRNDVCRKVVSVFMPCMTASKKILILNINKMIRATNLVTICPMNAGFNLSTFLCEQTWNIRVKNSRAIVNRAE
mmetsp:Transcript_8563/g.15490  ORF Transcript_8563/g.15490 Transcript_8563/m.15490 type:complete len:259 (+) Transcript_8563:424-1200(+)